MNWNRSIAASFLSLPGTSLAYRISRACTSRKHGSYPLTVEIHRALGDVREGRLKTAERRLRFVARARFAAREARSERAIALQAIAIALQRASVDASAIRKSCGPDLKLMGRVEAVARLDLVHFLNGIGRHVEAEAVRASVVDAARCDELDFLAGSSPLFERRVRNACDLESFAAPALSEPQVRDDEITIGAVDRASNLLNLQRGPHHSAPRPSPLVELCRGRSVAIVGPGRLHLEDQAVLSACQIVVRVKPYPEAGESDLPVCDAAFFGPRDLEVLEKRFAGARFSGRLIITKKESRREWRGIPLVSIGSEIRGLSGRLNWGTNVLLGVARCQPSSVFICGVNFYLDDVFYRPGKTALLRESGDILGSGWRWSKDVGDDVSPIERVRPWLEHNLFDDITVYRALRRIMGPNLRLTSQLTAILDSQNSHLAERFALRGIRPSGRGRLSTP